VTGFRKSRVYPAEVRVNLPVHSALTPREVQVLQRLLEGCSTRDIAVSYGIGHQTVKNYVTVIYEKVGVRHRAQLLRMCHVPHSDDTRSSTNLAER
jgi:DNA-binding CsgD family transcriptional regulator